MSEELNPQRQKVDLWFSGIGPEAWGITANEHGVSFWMTEMFWIQREVMVVQYCEFTKGHCIIHFKGLSFVIFELH